MPDPTQFQRVREHFTRLSAMPRADRAQALQALEAQDEPLHSEVAALLDHDSRDSDIFEQAGRIGQTLDRALQPAELPKTIGPYQILGVLGEGGMAIVYRARQDTPRRDVAIKALHTPSLSAASDARFNLEIEILGRLDHPAIARIYHAGTDTIAGVQRRYLAMELVEGKPITAHAEINDLDLRERLNLFCKVCDAVQHAHQQGVIHRDLKPDNVLIARSPDGTPTPKVLDFGVARATNHDLAPTTGPTLAGQLVGTLAYMSPEQLAGDPARIDTRSDVYSLGIILYELIAGRLPHDIADKPITEAIHVLRTTEPLRPRIASRVFGDELETITLTALAKDADRRYASASELAADIRRWLADEPIIARPPSRVYRVRKFAKRNKLAVASAAAILLTLIAGLTLTSAALAREAEARRAADANAALAAERESEARAALLVSRATTALLERALERVTPQAAAGRDVSLLREVLDDATAAAAIDLGPFPAERAALLTTFGEVYLGIGEFEAATAVLEDAVAAAADSAPDDIAREARRTLARAHHYTGRLNDAGDLLAEDLEAVRDAAGPDELATHLAFFAELRLAQLDTACLELAREAVDVARDAEPLTRARTHFVLGAVLRATGDSDGAADNYRETEALAAQADDVILRTTALNSLAAITRVSGDLTAAEALYRESIDKRTTRDDRPHPDIAVMLSNLGRTLYLQDKLDDALAALDESIAMHRQVYPTGHVNLALPMATRGRVLSELGRHAEAVEQIQAAITMLKDTLPALHPFLVTAYIDLGNAHRVARDGPAAERAFHVAEDTCESAGIDSPYYRVPIIVGLADALDLQGRNAEGRRLLEGMLAEPDLPRALRESLLEAVAALDAPPD